MHDPNDPFMNQFDYEVMVDSYYENIKHPSVVMPDGNVYKLHCGQMSGLYTTGQDNSFGHELIKIYEYIELLGDPKSFTRSYLKEFTYAIVGDDVLNGSNFEVPASHTKRCYADFGFEVKVEQSHRSTDINGIGFLSFKYFNDEHGKRILFDRNKILCSVVNEPLPTKKNKLEIYATRISMLTLLCAFDVPLCNFLISLYREIRGKYDLKSPPSYILDPRYLQDLWLGEEGNYLYSSLIQNGLTSLLRYCESNFKFGQQFYNPQCLTPEIAAIDINMEDGYEPPEYTLKLSAKCLCSKCSNSNKTKKYNCPNKGKLKTKLHYLYKVDNRISVTIYYHGCYLFEYTCTRSHPMIVYKFEDFSGTEEFGTVFIDDDYAYHFYCLYLTWRKLFNITRNNTLFRESIFNINTRNMLKCLYVIQCVNTTILLCDCTYDRMTHTWHRYPVFNNNGKALLEYLKIQNPKYRYYDGDLYRGNYFFDVSDVWKELRPELLRVMYLGHENFTYPH